MNDYEPLGADVASINGNRSAAVLAEVALPRARRNEEGTGSWEDPDISILDDRRGELPEFPLDVLSARWREWVVRAARASGTTPAHVAVPLLGIISALIGTARRVQACRSWTEPVAFWTGIIGFSGSGKTPGLNATKRALSMVERLRRSEIEEAQRQHEGKLEAAKAARAAWKKQVEAAAQGNVVELRSLREIRMPPEAALPRPFVSPRLYVSNSTIERLAVLLEARPRGMLLIADELAALFLNMSRYSGGQDNEFWLEAWNGNSYTVERIGREALMIPHLLVGMVGGFQPDKLARCFKGPADGMYARFCFAWPSEPDYQPLTNEVAEVEPEIMNALNRIIDLEDAFDRSAGFAPRAVPLSDDAVAEFEAFRQYANNAKHSLEGREREWWAKAEANVLRIAGTLAFLSWAMTGRDEPKQIEVRFVKAAVELVREYFAPHSQAALRQIGFSDRQTDARRVLRWLKAEARTAFSREEVRRQALSRSLDADQTQKLIDGLEKSGWFREVTKARESAGRPPRRWIVNPRLWT